MTTLTGTSSFAPTANAPRLCAASACQLSDVPLFIAWHGIIVSVFLSRLRTLFFFSALTCNDLLGDGSAHYNCDGTHGWKKADDYYSKQCIDGTCDNGECCKRKHERKHTGERISDVARSSLVFNSQLQGSGCVFRLLLRNSSFQVVFQRTHGRAKLSN